jgi:hypothetical protein
VFDRPDGALEFDLKLNLKRYELPDTAEVILESYTTTHLERFPGGTVGNLLADRRRLNGLNAGDRPLFRVKVVEPTGGNGRLLAAIDEVRAEEHDSLLPIIWKPKEEMDQLFWIVHFTAGSETQPELWMNKDVAGLYDDFRRHNPFICGLVLPAAYKSVLQRLIFDDGAAWVEDGSLLGRWLRFCLSLGAQPFDDNLEPGDDDWDIERAAWIEDVVRLFARAHLFLDGVARERSEDPT